MKRPETCRSGMVKLFLAACLVSPSCRQLEKADPVSPPTKDTSAAVPGDSSPSAPVQSTGPDSSGGGPLSSSTTTSSSKALGSSGSGERSEQERAPSAQEAFRRLLGDMGVQYLPAERKLEVKGWVNMQKGLVEVFACAPGGKTHEAVVVIDCVPSGLHGGLLALGLKPGTPVEVGTQGEYKPPTGDKVEIRVRWIGSDQKEHMARAEDWVWNQRDERPMKPGAWIFAGSFMQAVSGKPQDRTYAANYVKSVVTTYHDSNSIIENPYQDGIDDTLYYANDKAVPVVGTPLTVIFSAAE